MSTKPCLSLHTRSSPSHTPQYLMLLACCSSSSGFLVLGGGTLGILSFPASSVDLLSQVQCVCVGVLSQVLSFLFALHVPLVLGELRWGNCMRGISANSSAWIGSCPLGGRQESLGTGACTKLPKEFGPEFRLSTERRQPS